MRSALLPLVVGSFLLVALVPAASAQAPTVDPNTAVGQWVEASFDVVQPDLRTMELTGRLLVREYTIDGDLMTADEMGDRYANSQRYTQTRLRGEDLVREVETQIADTLRASLGSSFPDATITVGEAAVDRSTLVAASGDAYAPGVEVDVAATVTRTSEQVGLGTLTDDSVEAVFLAGAAVRTEFMLAADPGYTSVYRISAPAAPAGLIFSSVDGGDLVDPDTMRVTVDNSLGSEELTRTVTLTLRHREATQPTEEDIRTFVDIALGSPDATSMPITTEITAEIRSLNLGERFASNSIPESVDLQFLSADALRRLVQTGAITPEQLAEADEAFLDAVHENLQKAFETERPEGGIEASQFARAVSAPFGSDTPLLFTASASGAKALEPGDGDKLDLALRIGATVKFDVPLPASSNGPSTYAFTAPESSEFVGEASRTVEGADETLTLHMRLKDRPEFTGRSSDLNIVVDLKDIDISIGKAIGGDMGNLVGEVQIRGELGILSLDDLPEDTRAQFRQHAELTYLPSDGIRLALQKGILNPADLKGIEDDLLAKAGEQLSAALGTRVAVTGAFDAASLASSLISSGKLSGDTPIVFAATAAFTKPLVGGGEPQAQAATALYTQVQEFDLPKFQGLDTAYKVILPPGLAVQSVDVTGGESSQGTENGRDWFTVSPSDESAHAKVAMAVTPSFVIAKFWPVLLLAVLIIFLLVGTPVAFVVMRRRRKKVEATDEE